MFDLTGKNIIVGVTGGIAAYKVPELVRLYVKSNANVEVIMTKSACEFVTPYTLSILSKNKVYTKLFESINEYDVKHISLADKADLFIIVPATANIIGKIANGIADDLLSSTIMATKSKVIIAPAMNVNMWNNSIVQENIKKLEHRGYEFIYPETGELACGYIGEGRLADINTIFNRTKDFFNSGKPLNNKKLLITLGGTREYIDPVRFVGNKSSGKMGTAIACEAVQMGAEVTIISTVDVSLSNTKIIRVESALEMLESMKNEFVKNDIIIMTAAVADYRPENYSEQKIKKELNNNELVLKLVKNPDLIKEMTLNKRDNQFIVGFAAETDNLIQNAKNKLASKNIDMIVANDVSRTDIGMSSDYNEVTLIFKDGKVENIAKNTKNNVARLLLKAIAGSIKYQVNV